MNTILVTGGAGFIGSHLCEKLLLQGYEVLSLDNFNASYEPEIKRSNVQRAIRHSHYKLINGDILDKSLIDSIMQNSKIDAVIHLAAHAGVRRSILSPLEYVDVDIKGTVALLEACKNHNIKKFIFASSSSVYGTSIPPFREDTPPDIQNSPYAAAKYAGEIFCKTYSSLYDIQSVCLRFFTVYGPRQRPDMAIHIFTKAILENNDINIYGDGGTTRDYTYVDDIVDGIIACLGLNCRFEAINLGNSSSIQLKQLIETIERKLGKTANIRYLPEQPGDVPTTFADIEKAKTLLGYNPKVALEDGIERFAAWYKKNRC